MMTETKDLKTFVSHFRETPGFNETAFTNLVEDTSEEVTLKILARFQVTMKESEDAIRKALPTRDRDAIWKTCHKVSGTSELLGFQEFAKTSKVLSHSLKASPDIESHLEELQSYLKACEKLNADIKANVPDLNRYLE